MNTIYNACVSRTRACPMAHPGANFLLIVPFVIMLLAGVAGCSFLKPARFTARHFVLRPTCTNSPTSGVPGSVAPGVGQVKMPAYLLNSSLAVRKGNNEIEYLDSAIWAERLDGGFQRVLAADLASILNTDQIQLSAWNKEQVTAEIYVAIDQFDLDTAGQGVLLARWRILKPGGEKLLKAGTSRLTRQGTAPDADLSAAIATLSELIADLSQELAKVIQASRLDTESRNGAATGAL